MLKGMIKVGVLVISVLVAIGFFNQVSTAASAATEATGTEKADSSTRTGGVKSLEKRIEQLEAAIGRDVEGDSWLERIQIGGLIEVEASYQTIDYGDPALDDEDNSDVDLATVELVVDARIARHVDGHVMFKYEDDDVFVDEGFITLTGSQAFPAYLIAGRQYLPFGYYDSHFVTDPSTLVLGETNQGSVVAGYRFAGNKVDLSAGIFNGEIDEIGDDDHIDSFVFSISAQPIEFLMAGVSYTSNLASSDAFSEAVVVDELADLVAGWSAFVTLGFMERFKLIGEYTAALDSFAAGEVYDAADTRQREPAAWNLELGAMITDRLELAVRYGGADDGGDVLPETHYGAVLNWGVFSNTNLALEYLHDDFEDDLLEADTVTAQLAVEF